MCVIRYNNKMQTKTFRQADSLFVNCYSVTFKPGSGYYLTVRIQRVVIEESVSVDQELDFGVPQGSVLGSENLLHVHQTC